VSTELRLKKEDYEEPEKRDCCFWSLEEFQGAAKPEESTVFDTLAWRV
jgi:hypothetical protein